MSTILDALRRAEVERLRRAPAQPLPAAGGVADPRWLAAGESSAAATSVSRQRRAWLWVAAMAWLLAASTSWLLQDAPKPPQALVPVGEVRPSASAVQAPTAAAPAMTLRLPMAPVSAPVVGARASAPRPAASSPPADKAALPWTQLPPTARERVAALTVSGAVHSPERQQRFVLVGGEIVREGAQIAPGIVLERIEPRALLLRVDGRRVLRPL
jgi:general secretion pathway protein B